MRRYPLFGFSTPTELQLAVIRAGRRLSLTQLSQWRSGKSSPNIRKVADISAALELSDAEIAQFVRDAGVQDAR